MAKTKDMGTEIYRKIGKYHFIMLLILLIGAAFLTEQGAWYFRTSVLPTQSPAPYDGTTLPVLKVAKWTALGSDEWSASYDQLSSSGKLIPLPVYDPSVLKTPVEELGWSSESDLNIRNAKITFSVPYMGNYKLDGLEYAGSHLAVDIKLPMNTPVYAIGNGIVVKASNQSTGFGNHIVIKHENFPGFSNASSKETYYSSYSHLDSINVRENDIVTKGQFIGKSGASGTATTPHLHFQIDKASAPWHPYWPFTYQESAAAGLTFTESINAGLGKDKALQTTINPMLYVQKYMNGFSTSSTYTDTTMTPEVNTTTPVNTVSTTPASSTPDDFDLPPTGTTSETTPANTETVIEVTPDPIENQAVELEISHDGNFIDGQIENIKVTALDASGNIAIGYKPSSEVYIDCLLGSVEAPDSLYAEDFNNGVAVFQITTRGQMPIQLKVDDGTISGQSTVLTSTLFSDVEKDNASYQAISFLKQNNVIDGYPDGSFKPDSVVSRVEALKFILNGINSNLISARELPFPDTSAREWYSDYVATGYNKSIVEGYPDSTFKPANTVNRAEFLKMLLTAMEVQVDKHVSEDVYKDVPMESWYAPYVKFAKDKNLIVIKEGKFGPEEGMTREETAELIYRTILLKVSGAPKYSSGIKLSETDTVNYFS